MKEPHDVSYDKITKILECAQMSEKAILLMDPNDAHKMLDNYVYPKVHYRDTDPYPEGA